jgi:DNA polymerase-4
MEDVGIDEAFLDISSIDKPSEEIAREIKRESRRKPILTAPSVSLEQTLAKIASDLET